MPKPGHRSRTLRRIHTTTPGGRRTIHYVKRKPQKALCSKCGEVLHGVPHERPYKMQTMAKTRKRPERPFGGVLCTRCMRLTMIQKARNHV